MFNISLPTTLTMTPEMAGRMSATMDIKPPHIQSAIDKVLATGQPTTYTPSPLVTSLNNIPNDREYYFTPSIGGLTPPTSTAITSRPTPPQVTDTPWLTPTPQVTAAPQTYTPAQTYTPLQVPVTSANISSTGNSNMATDTTTTTSGLSEFAQPYAEYGLAEALRQYQAGAPAYYPGQTYTEFAPQTEQALRAAEQRALSGSPVMQAGQDYLQNVLSGGFLGGSPGLQAAIERATRPAQAAAMSSLAQRGRLGSGLGSQAVAQTVGDIAANISYQDYANERARQQQAMAYAPQFAQADYYDIAQLGQVGAAREAQAQRAIEDAMARYQYEQTAPQQQLGQYLSSVYGFPGQQQTTVTPLYEPSRGQQFLGGAAALGSLYGEGAGFGERLPGMLLGGLLANI